MKFDTEFISRLRHTLREKHGVEALVDDGPDGHHFANGTITVNVYTMSESSYPYNFRDVAKPHHHGYHYQIPDKFVEDLATVLRGGNACYSCDVSSTA